MFQAHQVGNIHPIKYYEGTIVDCDDNFIMFDDGSVLNVMYIHSIILK